MNLLLTYIPLQTILEVIDAKSVSKVSPRHTVQDAGRTQTRPTPLISWVISRGTLPSRAVGRCPCWQTCYTANYSAALEVINGRNLNAIIAAKRSR